MDIKVGCCGFPRSRAEYYKTFKVVEVQQTFYQPPALATAEKWRSGAPADFEFTLKAWQLVTHECKSPTYRRLRLPWVRSKLGKCGSFRPTEEVFWAWEQTQEIARVLGGKYIVFQCPASFQPTVENRKNLDNFFKKIPRKNFSFVWEPRGNWRMDEVQEICAELDLIHGVDPFQGAPQFGRIRYFRLHGITGYRYPFNQEDLLSLRERCQGISNCLFNNVSMWADALAFRDLIQKDKGTRGRDTG